MLKKGWSIFFIDPVEIMVDNSICDGNNFFQTETQAEMTLKLSNKISTFSDYSILPVFRRCEYNDFKI